MTDRRAFIRTLAGALLVAPLGAEAQQAGKVARIGYLGFSPLDSPGARVILDAFRQGLRERGYVEGQNIVIEYRSADGKIDRLPRLATELARLKVDLIVSVGSPGARAVQQATTTIPIVAAAMGDPVGDGLVASLARPGGNITGSTFHGQAARADDSAVAAGAGRRGDPVSGNPNPDMSQIVMVDSRVAEILRRMSGMERLRLAHELWGLTRDRLTAFLRSYHPEWDKAELQRRVADWLLHGSLAAFVAPHPALSPEGRGMRGPEGRG